MIWGENISIKFQILLLITYNKADVYNITVFSNKLFEPMLKQAELE